MTESYDSFLIYQAQYADAVSEESQIPEESVTASETEEASEPESPEDTGNKEDFVELIEDNAFMDERITEDTEDEATCADVFSETEGPVDPSGIETTSSEAEFSDEDSIYADGNTDLSPDGKPEADNMSAVTGTDTDYSAEERSG